MLKRSGNLASSSQIYGVSANKSNNFKKQGENTLKKPVGEVRKQILILAWPSMIEQILLMLAGILNTLFVGWLGKDEMSAVGMVNSLITFLQGAP